MAAVIAGARARAEALRGAMGSSADAEQLAITLLVSRGLSGLWLQRRWHSQNAAQLLREAADIAGVPVESFTLGVSLYTLCDPTLLELPPQLAIEAQIELLRALARLESVSLWSREAGGSLRCHSHAGTGKPSRRQREVARAALGGNPSEEGGAGRTVVAVPVMRWQRPYAALVGRVARGERERGLAFLDQAAAMIGPMLERQSLLEHNAEREHSLVQASERRLTRLGFDLHDQPLQEVAALAGDMRRFRQQLASVVVGEHRDLLVGRVQDLEARLAALDTGLRALCNSLEPPTLLARSLPELLQREIDAYAARTEMSVGLRIVGELGRITDSQRIALVRIIQECLSNAREHSGASEVRVELKATGTHIEASVTDNGRGFDVDAALLDAARRGRLGLVGVHERTRLLGGACEVTSKPGGPTTVAIVLTRWHGSPLGETAGVAAS
jgi:signal transduction histidine kinase